jgi:hypothetical protein
MFWNSYIGLLTWTFIINIAGSVCNNGFKQLCTGTSWSDANESSCKPCPAGSACSKGIKTACIGSTWSDSNSASCQSCTGGYSCSGGLRSKCFIGSYSLDGEGSCSVCPPGLYTDSIGQSGCMDCEEGYMCGGGIKSPCLEGTYAAMKRSTSCTSSLAGYHVPTTGASDQTVCLDGKYSQARASECFDCPSGNSILSYFTNLVTK